jgi:hypothetical protein
VVRRILKSRKGQALAGVLTVVLAASISWAAWSVITSTGSGSGKTGSLTAPTISNGTTLVADTFPSSPAGSFNATGTLTMTIDNPNAGALTLTGFTIDDDAVVGGNAQCDFGAAVGGVRNTYLFVKGQATAAASAPAVAQTGLSIAVPPGVSQVNVPGIIGLTSDTASTCQAQSIDGFTITAANFQTG